MNNYPIGILDSGVGGLSVLQAIQRELPDESLVYIADSKNSPYGIKNKETILTLSRRMIQFLLGKHVKLIVVACNTISVLCLDDLRRQFPKVPIIGIVPVIKTAVSISKNKNIGILSTSATAKSEYQQNLIQQFGSDCNVVTVGADSLVPFVERGEINSSQLEAVLVSELASFVRENVDTLALGCSHFPFLKEIIQHVLGEGVTLIDSSAAVARQTKRVLQSRNEFASDRSAKNSFYTTGQNTNTILELMNGTIAEKDINKINL